MPTYYAIVTFGPAIPGPSVFASANAAAEHLIRCEADTQGGGRYWTDPQSLAGARVNEYTTRTAARRADISDTTDTSRGRQTPGFVGTVLVRG